MALSGDSNRIRTAFGILLGLSLVARIAYSGAVPLTGDELMHWQWARHLDLGYPEHPPLVAWLIALFTGLFGHHPWTVRLVSILAVTGTFALMFRLGRELFGARAAFFAAVPLMVTPILNVGGLLANTDGLLSFFWILTVYGVKKAVVDEDAKGWLWAGGAAGLALLTKLTAGLLAPATLLAVLGTREGRGWMRRWEPYGAAALAMLIFSPTLIWNLQHGWRTVAMRFGHQTAGGFTLRYTGELIGAQLLTISPILFGWVLWGLWKSWPHRAESGWVVVGSYFVVPLAFFVSFSLFARAGIHWPAMGYLTGFLLAGASTAELWERGRSRWFLPIATAPAVLLTALLFAAPFLLPRLPEISWPGRPDKISTKQSRNLIDWRQLGTAIEERIDAGKGKTFLLCQSGYGIAGLAAFYTPTQPDVFLWRRLERNGAAYNQWRDEADLQGWNAVIVSDNLDQGWFDEVRSSFDTLSSPQPVRVRREEKVERTFYLLYGTGFSGFPADPPSTARLQRPGEREVPRRRRRG